MKIKFENFDKSITGKVRSENQDSSLICTNEDFDNGILNLLAIADGMGGLNYGSIASKTAIDSLKFYLKNIDFENTNKEKILIKLNEISFKINNDINEKGNELGGNLGTTLSYLITTTNYFFISHIGDTRIYEVIDNEKSINFNKLTEDHNLENRKNVLTKYLGSNKIYDPFIVYKDFNSDKIFLLASDGFYNSIDENIKNLFININESLAEKLVDYANKKLGNDNISIIISKQSKI